MNASIIIALFLIAALLLAVSALLFLPIWPARKRVADAPNLTNGPYRMTPEIEKARKSSQKRVKSIQDSKRGL